MEASLSLILPLKLGEAVALRMSHPLGQNGKMNNWLERTETVLLLALWGTVLWLCLKVAFWVLSLLRGGFMALVEALR